MASKSLKFEDKVVICISEDCKLNRFAYESCFIKEHRAHQYVTVQDFQKKIDVPKNFEDDILIEEGISFKAELEDQFQAFQIQMEQKIRQFQKSLSKQQFISYFFKRILTSQLTSVNDLQTYRNTLFTITIGPQKLDTYQNFQKDVVELMIGQYRLKNSKNTITSFIENQKYLIQEQEKLANKLIQECKINATKLFQYKPEKEIIQQNPRQMQSSISDFLRDKPQPRHSNDGQGLNGTLEKNSLQEKDKSQGKPTQIEHSKILQQQKDSNIKPDNNNLAKDLTQTSQNSDTSKQVPVAPVVSVLPVKKNDRRWRRGKKNVNEEEIQTLEILKEMTLNQLQEEITFLDSGLKLLLVILILSLIYLHVQIIQQFEVQKTIIPSYINWFRYNQVMTALQIGFLCQSLFRQYYGKVVSEFEGFYKQILSRSTSILLFNLYIIGNNFQTEEDLLFMVCIFVWLVVSQMIIENN